MHSAQSNWAEARAVAEASAGDASDCVAREWQLSLEIREQPRAVELDAYGRVLLVEALWLHARLSQVREHRECERLVLRQREEHRVRARVERVRRVQLPGAGASARLQLAVQSVHRVHHAEGCVAQVMQRRARRQAHGVELVAAQYTSTLKMIPRG